MTRLYTLLLLLLSAPLFCQNDFTLEQILGAPFPSDLTAAPAGDRVAWIFNDEGARNIWVAEGPNLAARKLTDYTEDDGQALAGLTFSPDGNHLYFERGGSPNRQGELPNPTSEPERIGNELWRIDLGPDTAALLGEGYNPLPSPDGAHLLFFRRGQPMLLTLADTAEAKPVFRIRGGVSSPRWSPDGSKLAFSNTRGDHSYIVLYDLASEAFTFLNPSLHQDSQPVWSPDGRRLAWLRRAHEKDRWSFIPRPESLPWSVLVAEVATGEVKTAWTAPPGPGSTFQSVAADRQLFWTAGDLLVFPWEGDGWTHLYALSPDRGEPRLLTPGDGEVQYVSLSHDGRTLLYDANIGDIDRKHLWRIDLPAGKATQLTTGDGIEWAPVLTAETRQVATLSSGPRLPAHPVKLEKGILRPLAPKAIPEDFPHDHLVTPQQVIFSAADGLPIHGQLFLPPGHQDGDQHPAVLFFHGGSRRQMLLGFHHRGYYHNAYALNQYLANQGYVVLSVNFRSGTGYGLGFREAPGYGAAGASEFNDVLGAGLYLRNRTDVDPGRIGLWGGSYGGYLTALGLARASDLFAAGVDIHGVHDWNVVIKNFQPDYETAEHPETARRAFEASPMAYLDGWRSPVLLIHGDDDRNVPFSESVDLAESLLRRDVYFEQLVFPDEVHGFLLHRSWLAAYRAAADFFDRMLKEK